MVFKFEAVYHLKLNFLYRSERVFVSDPHFRNDHSHTNGWNLFGDLRAIFASVLESGWGHGG